MHVHMFMFVFAISDSIHERTVIRDLKWAAIGDIQAEMNRRRLL